MLLWQHSSYIYKCIYIEYPFAWWNRYYVILIVQHNIRQTQNRLYLCLGRIPNLIISLLLVDFTLYFMVGRSFQKINNPFRMLSSLVSPKLPSRSIFSNKITNLQILWYDFLQDLFWFIQKNKNICDFYWFCIPNSIIRRFISEIGEGFLKVLVYIPSALHLSILYENLSLFSLTICLYLVYILIICEKYM